MDQLKCSNIGTDMRMLWVTVKSLSIRGKKYDMIAVTIDEVMVTEPNMCAAYFNRER